MAKKKAPKNKKKVSKKASAPKQKSPLKKSGLGMPYGDRVLVKPTPVEQVTSFGIIIPDSSKEKPEQGVVVAVGHGKRDEAGTLHPLHVKAGDRIMFSKYGYDEITINGQDYYLIREESITYIF